MNEKIKVQVFGVQKKIIVSGCGCGSRESGCCNTSNDKKNCCKTGNSGCGNGTNKCCSSKGANSTKTVGDAYKELEKFINDSDVKNNTELEFIDLEKNKLKENQFIRIEEIIKKGFEPPITVVDNIIRYYGGISNALVYNDIKELLE